MIKRTMLPRMRKLSGLMAFAGCFWIVAGMPCAGVAGDAPSSGVTAPSPTVSRPLSEALGGSDWSQPPSKDVSPMQGVSRPGSSRKDPFVPSYYNTRPDFSQRMQSDKLPSSR